jgi:hypothetical protein
LVTTGPGTIVSHAATGSMGATYNYSLHDTNDPAHAAAHNEIWPRGAGQTVTFNQGLVVHHRDATITNSVMVTTA